MAQTPQIVGTYGNPPRISGFAFRVGVRVYDSDYHPSPAGRGGGGEGALLLIVLHPRRWHHRITPLPPSPPPLPSGCFKGKNKVC